MRHVLQARTWSTRCAVLATQNARHVSLILTLAGPVQQVNTSAQGLALGVTPVAPHAKLLPLSARAVQTTWP